ncbi:hypothetical protein CEP54_015616 [Fusarium duplospermum]|uniref:Uncharacterized protein n=1 Tax=Fusarium duplospermum TaxID=1325734 RepID=A0A428NMQ4_9HYPO|nr:hypothetical protein CEP54_015616 [Fusarium duplospermum]
MSLLANKDALRAYVRGAMVLNSLKVKAIKGKEEKEEDRQVPRAKPSSINNLEFWHEVERGLGTMERAHRFLDENTSNEEYRQLFAVFCRFRARESALFGPASRIQIHREQPKTPHMPSHYYLRPKRAGILWVYGSQVGYIGKESSRILGELCSLRAFLQCYELPSLQAWESAQSAQH